MQDLFYYSSRCSSGVTRLHARPCGNRNTCDVQWSGDVLGPDHRVTAYEGLKAITLWPAFQHFEEKVKGSIEVGKQADFVILSADRLTVGPLTLADIKVLETINNGLTVFE